MNIKIESTISVLQQKLKNLLKRLLGQPPPNSIEHIQDVVLKLFARTTATWDRQPQFQTYTRIEPKEIELVVSTTDKIYSWLNYGIKAHKIKVRHAQVLAYPEGYDPKTIVGRLDAVFGGSEGPVLWHGQEVTHPGIKPRRFDMLVAKELEKRFEELGAYVIDPILEEMTSATPEQPS